MSIESTGSGLAWRHIGPVRSAQARKEAREGQGDLARRLAGPVRLRCLGLQRKPEYARERRTDDNSQALLLSVLQREQARRQLGREGPQKPGASLHAKGVLQLDEQLIRVQSPTVEH